MGKLLRNPGLTLSSDNLIVGRPERAGPSQATFTVRRKSDNVGTTVSLDFTITANAIRPAALPSGLVGSAYSQQLSADLPGTPSWAVTGSPPAGLTLDPRTGLISGRPLSAGSWQFVAVARAGGKEARGTLRIDVLAPSVLRNRFATSQLVSSATGGAALSGKSWAGGISDDGVWAVFATMDNALAPAKGLSVVLKNLTTGEARAVVSPASGLSDTVGLSGDGGTILAARPNTQDPRNPFDESVLLPQAGGAGVRPSDRLAALPGALMSADGRYLFFSSAMSLGPGPSFRDTALWRWDRTTHQFLFVSLMPDGTPATHPTLVSVAPDGQSAVFRTWVNTTTTTLRRDLATSTSTVLTMGSADNGGHASDNGRWTAALRSPDEGIVVIDQVTHARTTYPVPHTVASWCPEFSDRAWISNDGNRIVFSGCTEGKPEGWFGLWAYDRITKKVITVSTRNVTAVQVSDDLRQVLYGATDTAASGFGAQVSLYVSRW